MRDTVSLQSIINAYPFSLYAIFVGLVSFILLVGSRMKAIARPPPTERKAPAGAFSPINLLDRMDKGPSPAAVI